MTIALQPSQAEHGDSSSLCGIITPFHNRLSPQAETALKDTSKRKSGRSRKDTKKEASLPGERLSLLSELTRRITSSLDIPIVLQEVVDAACELTGVRYWALLVLDSAGDIQEFITHGITAEE